MVLLKNYRYWLRADYPQQNSHQCFELDLLDFDWLDFDWLGSDSLGFDSLRFDLLDFDLLEFDLLHFLALGFLVLGFPWLHPHSHYPDQLLLHSLGDWCLPGL